MDGGIEFAETPISFADYSYLRKAASWGDIDEPSASRGLSSSLYSVQAISNGRVVGIGRVVGDGGIYFYVQDVIVLPEFRGKGIGRRIMDRITHFLRSNAPHGAFVGLMAANGTSSFYERYGFVTRDDGSPGMFLAL